MEAVDEEMNVFDVVLLKSKEKAIIKKINRERYLVEVVKENSNKKDYREITKTEIDTVICAKS